VKWHLWSFLPGTRDWRHVEVRWSLGQFSGLHAIDTVCCVLLRNERALVSWWFTGDPGREPPKHQREDPKIINHV
jgi:hypothetical protein